HRSAAVLCLGPREIGDAHCHTQQLLLNERHATSAREDGLKQRMERNDRFFSGARCDAGMHHLAHDGTGPDKSHFDYEIVEILGLKPWERRHLSAAFHLEHSNRVALLQGLIDDFVILGKPPEIDFLPPMVPDKPEAILQ